MKKKFSGLMLMTAFIACSLFSASTYAQTGKHTPGERAKMITDSLKSKLALTDDQYSKVYDLNVNYITKMQDLRQQSGTKEEKMQSFKQLRKSQNEDIKAVLTKDQLEKYKTMQKEKRRERQGHRGKGSSTSE